MAITTDGWLDWAQRVPGPADKRYAEPCTSNLYVPHSAVGYLNGWYDRLFSTARDAQGRYTPYAAASVTGWINYDGTVIQHYPFTVACWASGSLHLNVQGNAFENEGGPPSNVSEPLTEAQIEANVRILREMAAWKGRNPATYWRRPTSAADLTATLYEHNETTRFGGSPTACPSNRIPWAEILRRLSIPSIPEETDMYHQHDGWGLGNFTLAGGQSQRINARSAFGVPVQARRIRVEFLAAHGYGVIRHGNTDRQAGRFGWGFPRGGASYQFAEVELGDDGGFVIFAEDVTNPIRLFNAHCVAWWN